MPEATSPVPANNWQRAGQSRSRREGEQSPLRPLAASGIGVVSPRRSRCCSKRQGGRGVPGRVRSAEQPPNTFDKHIWDDGTNEEKPVAKYWARSWPSGALRCGKICFPPVGRAHPGWCRAAGRRRLVVGHPWFIRPSKVHTLAGRRFVEREDREAVVWIVAGRFTVQEGDRRALLGRRRRDAGSTQRKT